MSRPAKRTPERKLQVVLSVAHGLLHDRTGYVAGLPAYRAGDHDMRVARFAVAGADGAAAAVGLVGHIDDLHREYRGRGRTRAGSPVNPRLARAHPGDHRRRGAGHLPADARAGLADRALTRRDGRPAAQRPPGSSGAGLGRA